MLPNELVRPKSYGACTLLQSTESAPLYPQNCLNSLFCHAAYHNFELEAYVRLALQAEQVNIDLWTFQAEEYNSILV